LLSQMLASCAFVFFVFMLGMKMKIGNKVLNFMGTITLEFYLIHGLFVELFGFNFVDARPAIHYIKNVALYVLVVLVLGLISAILLQKLHNLILGKYKKPAAKSKTE
ncbi:MAG: acyltransferase family protein, partial [Lachnospiraceae bacterium]|nr:acyltransferase family protein [Lachnospiraceae bacterium]